MDDAKERRLHQDFVGREAALAELDSLLVDDSVDRWVVVTGGQGTGSRHACLFRMGGGLRGGTAGAVLVRGGVRHHAQALGPRHRRPGHHAPGSRAARHLLR